MILAVFDVLIALSSIVIGSFVFIKNPRNSINNIFYFLMLTVAIWSFIEIQSVLSTNLNMFLFWDNFDFVWMLTIMMFLHFSLSYTNSSLLKNNYFLYLMYGIAFFSMFIHYIFVLETNAVLSNGIWYSDFSGVSETLNNIFLGIFSLIALIALIICIRFYFGNNDKLLRKKTLFIIAGLTIPVIGGITTDVILEVLYSEILPITTIHFIFGTIIFFSYAIWRYDVFSIDIDTAAEKIVSTMSDSLFLINFDKKIKFINDTAEKMTGLKEKDLTGKSISTILFNKDSQLVINMDNSKDVDASLKNKYGTIIPVSISSSVVKDDHGDIKGYVITCRDITERKKTEEELIKLATIVKHSSELVNLATLDGKMIFLNDAGCKMLGIDSENLEQVNIMQVIPDHLVNLVTNNLLPCLTNGRTWEGELQYKNLKNGQLVDVHAMTFPINDPYTGKPHYLSNVSLDITKQKQSENDLKKAKKLLEKMNNELEKKVAERTQEVSKLLKQKDEFISQLGHDLKNPLGPFISLLPVLEKKVDDPKSKEIIEVLNRNANYMKKLITDILELARLNSPNTEFKMKKLNLNELVDSIIEKNTYLFMEKNMHVVKKVPDTIELYADELRLEELFNNLLNNAVKYSYKDGDINISTEVRDTEILFMIQDYGLGMTESQLERIFDEFYKADESRHDFESSGLGMPISKRIVEKHGGRIWVESNGIGKGSTFYFTLPLN